MLRAGMQKFKNTNAKKQIITNFEISKNSQTFDVKFDVCCSDRMPVGFEFGI
jgi:hypothetical protein